MAALPWGTGVRVASTLLLPISTLVIFPEPVGSGGFAALYVWSGRNWIVEHQMPIQPGKSTLDLAKKAGFDETSGTLVFVPEGSQRTAAEIAMTTSDLVVGTGTGTGTGTFIEP